MRNTFQAAPILLCAALLSGIMGGLEAQEQPLKTIGFHDALYDADGKLLPWTSWDDAIGREMQWYLKCPVDSHGYATFVFTTFMDGDY
jgi:hypothetical protein